jgi:hypothetical protein
LIPVLRLRGGNPGRQRQSPRGQRERCGFQQGPAIHVAIHLMLQSNAKAAINAGRLCAPGDYVLLNCGASVPGENRDEMAFTSACDALSAR